MSDASALRCSFAADARGDQLAGTAAYARGFVLVESPGAWGSNALTESSLDPDLAAALAARAASMSYRVLLIKRPGRADREPHRPRRWAVIDSGVGVEAVRWGTYASDADLVGLPLDEGDETPGGGEPGAAAPLYLVCTHGRRDACCALRGRAAAAALAALRPDAVWECSHIGGDRFAPNLLVLPQGLYYGRVAPSRAADIVGAQERSEVVVDLLRGRAIFRPAVQAAQHFARRAGGAAGMDALEPIASRTSPGGDVVVELAIAGGAVTVTVRPTVGETAGLLTCKATHPLHPPRFELLEIDGGA